MTGASGLELGARERRPAGESFRLSYRPALDGLRGVAVLAVLAYHDGNIRYVNGGYLGVDVFFVLSGFLITALLMQEWNRDGDVSFKNFYMRRVLRLMPALLTLLLAYAAYVSLVTPELIGEASEAIAASLFYFTNWARVFDLDIDLSHLGHTWSLAIEEQFYLIWPPLLVLALRLGVKRRWLLWFVVAGIAASAALRAALWLNGYSVGRVYFGLDTRADALLTGCLTGLLASYNLLPRAGWSRRLLRAGAFLSTFLLACLVVYFHTRSHMYMGLFTVAALLVAVVLAELVSSAPSKFVTLILAFPPLVWVGRLSYGLYLWHLPIFRIVEVPGWGEWQVTLFCFALTFLCAALSFYLIELPVLGLKKRFESDRAAERRGAQPVAAA